MSHSGQEVVVYTDHNPLVFLAKLETSNPRLFRWALVLQPYSLVVLDMDEKENALADVLSHIPVVEPT